MNKQLLSIVAITLSLSIFGALAAEATQDKPAAAQGTSAERKAERAKKRAELAAAQKKGEVPKVAEANQDKPAMAKGTSAERKAERAKVRAETAKANKEGKIPVTTEAGVETKK